MSEQKVRIVTLDAEGKLSDELTLDALLKSVALTTDTRLEPLVTRLQALEAAHSEPTEPPEPEPEEPEPDPIPEPEPEPEPEPPPQVEPEPAPTPPEPSPTSPLKPSSRKLFGIDTKVTLSSLEKAVPGSGVIYEDIQKWLANPNKNQGDAVLWAEGTEPAIIQHFRGYATETDLNALLGYLVGSPLALERTLRFWRGMIDSLKVDGKLSSHRASSWDLDELEIPQVLGSIGLSLLFINANLGKGNHLPGNKSKSPGDPGWIGVNGTYEALMALAMRLEKLHENPAGSKRAVWNTGSGLAHAVNRKRLYHLIMWKLLGRAKDKDAVDTLGEWIKADWDIFETPHGKGMVFRHSVGGVYASRGHNHNSWHHNSVYTPATVAAAVFCNLLGDDSVWNDEAMTMLGNTVAEVMLPDGDIAKLGTAYDIGGGSQLTGTPPNKRRHVTLRDGSTRPSRWTQTTDDGHLEKYGARWKQRKHPISTSRGHTYLALAWAGRDTRAQMQALKKAHARNGVVGPDAALLLMLFRRAGVGRL